jgi:hypothetical protein
MCYMTLSDMSYSLDTSTGNVLYDMSYSLVISTGNVLYVL